jgi:predicted GNAT family acetyltransferase
MTIYTYQSANEFLHDNQQVLVEQEAISQLILYNAIIKRDAPSNKTCLFGSVQTDSGHKILLFCNIEPYNLQLHSLSDDVSLTKEAVQTLVSFIFAVSIPIRGLNANKRLCDLFTKEYLLRNTTCHLEEVLGTDILELRSLMQVPIAEGKFRLAKPHDLVTLTRWNVEFAKEALNYKLEYDRIIEKVSKQIVDDIFYVYEDGNGQIVSMAAVTRQLLNGVAISYVYTPKTLRNQGYCVSLMYRLCSLMLEKGNRFCTLFVDKKNPISNNVYKKIGYQIIDNNYDIRIIEDNLY